MRKSRLIVTDLHGASRTQRHVFARIHLKIKGAFTPSTHGSWTSRSTPALHRSEGREGYRTCIQEQDVDAALFISICLKQRVHFRKLADVGADFPGMGSERTDGLIESTCLTNSFTVARGMPKLPRVGGAILPCSFLHERVFFFKA